MAENGKPTGWWHTLPGVMTGMAGLLTAIVALVQLFGHDPKPDPVPLPPVQDSTAILPIDGKTGYYDWQFVDGRTGTTRIQLDETGILHGTVVGSEIDWNYWATREID